MTPKEVDALPVGPFKRTQRPVTMDDIKRGTVGRVVETVESVPVKLRAYRASDPLFYYDSEGHKWIIGEWADGQKFKEPFGGI